MHKILIIFKHEFLHTIKRMGFIVLTLIVPLMVLLAIGTNRLVSFVNKPVVREVKAMGYVDDTGDLADNADAGPAGLVRFGTREKAVAALSDGTVSEFFVIPPDFPQTGRIKRFILEKEIETPAVTKAFIKNFLTTRLLSGKVSPQLIRLVEAPLQLEVTRLTREGALASEQGGLGNMVIPGLFAILLCCCLMFGANYMIEGLGEEKESRLIEVLLSSVSVRQLLTGKVLGLGAAGLLQALFWVVSVPLLANIASSSLHGFFETIRIPPNFIVLGIIYFILGYLLFAVLSIAVGAISPNAREGQQLALIYTLFSFVPLWLLSLLFFFPRSPVWVVLSIFPVTAPVQTLLRLGIVDIPAWQLLTSIAVLVFSIVGGMYLAVKIFRVHLLIHGKRPSLGEVVRNLKFG